MFWSPNNGDTVAYHSQTLIERYLTDVSADSGESDDVYGVGRQYYDGVGFADAGQTYDPSQVLLPVGGYLQTESDPDSPCYGDTSAYCVSDGDIQTKLKNLISDPHDPLPTGLGAGAPIYFVITPDDADVCISVAECASSSGSDGFCGYHSYFADGSADVVYAVVPFLPVATHPKWCQTDGTSEVQEPNADPADIVIDNLSHESNEAITDPIPFTGWATSSDDEEAADLCQNVYQPLGGTKNSGDLFDQIINGQQYYTQTLWSNGNGNCEAEPAPGQVTAAFSQSSLAVSGQTTVFNPSASTASNGFSSETWNFGDGESQFKAGAPTTSTHVYAAPGVYTVSLTVVDSDGNLATSSRTVTVFRPLNVSILPLLAGHPATRSPIMFEGSATDPNPGGTIAFYRWNFGDGAGAFGYRASHAFVKAGDYTVTLTATDTLGVETSVTRAVKVIAQGEIERARAITRASRPEVDVTVNEPGMISVGPALARLNRAGSATLPVPLTPSEAFAEAVGARFTVRVRIAYAPSGGPTVIEHLVMRF